MLNFTSNHKFSLIANDYHLIEHFRLKRNECLQLRAKKYTYVHCTCLLSTRFSIKKQLTDRCDVPATSTFIDPMYRNWFLGHSADEANLFMAVTGMLVLNLFSVGNF